MLTTASPSADVRLRHAKRTWWFGYFTCLFVTVMVAGIAMFTAPRPPFSLALLIVAMGGVVTLVRPVVGVYLIVFLVLVGDIRTSGWYPFNKNLSSVESILYVSDQIIVSPLELYLATALLGWVLHMLGTRRWTFQRGRLFWPMMAFVGFLLVGMAYGLASGGDRYVAIVELRPLLYLPILYVLVTNLFHRNDQYQRLFVVMMVAITVNAVISLDYYRALSAIEKLEITTLVQHSNAVPMNAMFILLVAAWLCRSRSAFYWQLLPLMAIPVVVAYLISERRSAMVGLAGGFILLAAVWRWVNPRMFRMVIPVLVLAFIGYTGAFWNSTGLVGFPAQAVKSVVAPEQQNEEDQRSDQYRKIENYDIVYTIKTNPVFGIGFGREFLQPVPLPEINNFTLAKYLPHNSVLWVWMKTGIFGFVAFLFLVGQALRSGARALRRSPGGDQGAITITAVAYVLMYSVFAFVDLAFDPQSMVFLAVSMATIAHASRGTAAGGSSPAVDPAVGSLVS